MKNMDIKLKKKWLATASLAACVCLLGGCAGTGEQTETARLEESSSQSEAAGAETESEAAQEQAEPQTESEQVQTETEAMTEQMQTEPESETESETESEISQMRERVKVKGIYVSGPIAGTSKMDELIELVEETELNALVIDVKNDEGLVTYKMSNDTVEQIGSGTAYIQDIDALVAKCKEKGIYLIARIVAFKDPYLAENCPQYAVKTKDGEIFYDKSGLAWVNPYNQEVWDYLVEIGMQAARDGFDEIQFDYIRFSTELKDDKVDFGETAQDKDRQQIITEFTQYAYDRLSAMGVYVAADVYGTVIDSEVDREIVGQDYVAMASILDYICPMVYPSHYANGVYGIAIPDAEPYATVKAAMDAATEQLADLPEEQCAINRVWIQSFTATWVDGHITYGAQQIRDEIQAVYDAGYDEWILWNASVKYQQDSLLTDEEAQMETMPTTEAETESGTVEGSLDE